MRLWHKVATMNFPHEEKHSKAGIKAGMHGTQTVIDGVTAPSYGAARFLTD